jgi:hypothetical protein
MAITRIPAIEIPTALRNTGSMTWAISTDLGWTAGAVGQNNANRLFGFATAAVRGGDLAAIWIMARNVADTQNANVYRAEIYSFDGLNRYPDTSAVRCYGDFSPTTNPELIRIPMTNGTNTVTAGEKIAFGIRSLAGASDLTSSWRYGMRSYRLNHPHGFFRNDVGHWNYSNFSYTLCVMFEYADGTMEIPFGGAPVWDFNATGTRVSNSLSVNGAGIDIVPSITTRISGFWAQARFGANCFCRLQTTGDSPTGGILLNHIKSNDGAVQTTAASHFFSLQTTSGSAILNAGQRYRIAFFLDGAGDLYFPYYDLPAANTTAHRVALMCQWDAHMSFYYGATDEWVDFYQRVPTMGLLVDGFDKQESGRISSGLY